MVSYKQIYVRGNAITPGYINRPDLTAKAFALLPSNTDRKEMQRFYFTGDCGHVVDCTDARTRTLYVAGRCDNVVKIRGYTVAIEVSSIYLCL